MELLITLLNVVLAVTLILLIEKSIDLNAKMYALYWEMEIYNQKHLIESFKDKQ